MIDKSTRQHYEMQGKVRNYLGKQKMVKAPKKWKSGPDHPDTELAYITKAEKDLILKADLHNSLSNGPNRGPSGIISLNSAGSGYGGPGPGSSGGGGRGGGGQDRMPVYSAPRPAPRPAPSPHRDPTPVAPTAVAPPSILSRPTPSETIGPSLHGDISEQKVADELNRQKEIRNIIKQGQEEKYGDTADPTKFGETITKLDVAISKPENERTIDDKLEIEKWESAQDYDKVKDLSKKGHSFEDIQKAMDKGLLTKADPQSMQTNLFSRGINSLRNLIPETGLERSLLGGLKKSFAPTTGGMFDPKNMAFGALKNMALKKLGLGAAVPWLGLLSFLPTLFGKTGYRDMFAKKPAFDVDAASKLGLYDKEVTTPTDTLTAKRVGEGTTAQKIATGEVDLNKLITGVAHGGRIDNPLMGRSRDI